jgi:hypothetical protein
MVVGNEFGYARHAIEQGLCLPVVKRLLACLIAAFLVAGISVPVVSAAARPAKVVIVVGPVGPGMTDRFRAQADEAARIARQYTSDVTVIASPNATWPRVKAALQDASVVVYMGHGNGWPSRYRDSLFSPTQNGFGLNPVAGGGDSKHQYFGEKYIREQVRLAKNAVVLLHHLCYASGNTEPGLPEGTLAQAKLRVDNYAAGFIDAGAAAVSADAYSSPAYMIRSVLQGRRSINSIWRNAPSANGNTFAFESTRSPGYVAQMDPDRGSSGFHRSIVLRQGLASRDVLANARGNAGSAPAQTSESEAIEPTLIGQGIKLDTPKFRGGMTTAGEKRLLRIPLEVKDRDKLPEKLKASVRWDPIEVSVVPAEPENEVAAEEADATEPEAAAEPEATPEASAEPAESVQAEASAEPAASAAPDASAGPEASAEPADPAATPAETIANGDAPAAEAEGVSPTTDAGAPAPSEAPGGDTTVGVREQPEPIPVEAPPVPAAPPDEVLLVQPEQIGDVVRPVKGQYRKYGVDFKVTMPEAAGLYRLTVTLHDSDGVAYDAATQALVSPMLVRVVGPFDAKVLATESASLESGTNVPLPVRVANLGTATWGEPAVVDHGRPGGGSPATGARVVGHWVALDPGTTTNLSAVSASLPSALEPGAIADASLDLAVPVQPGNYLLVLDVVTPSQGSLASLAVPPTMVRVTVLPAP